MSPHFCILYHVKKSRSIHFIYAPQDFLHLNMVTPEPPAPQHIQPLSIIQACVEVIFWLILPITFQINGILPTAGQPELHTVPRVISPVTCVAVAWCPNFNIQFPSHWRQMCHTPSSPSCPPDPLSANYTLDSRSRCMFSNKRSLPITYVGWHSLCVESAWLVMGTFLCS